MRIKKWEKWYWGIILSLATLITIAIITDTFILNWYGRRLDLEWSKTKQFWVVVPIFLGIFFVIWLICRLVGGSGEKE